MKYKLPALLLPVIALSGCVDIPDFSNTPTIYYNGISQFTEIDTLDVGTVQRYETVILSVRFEDGDGDLGENVQDLQNPEVSAAYARASGWGLPANYEAVTMTKQPNGSWNEAVFSGDSVNFFPVLKTDGKPGPIKGVLDMYIRNPIGNTSVMAERRYKVRIIDRAFHISNQIEVPEEDAVTVPIPRN